MFNTMCLRIKESKFPDMREKNRYIMTGVTQECLDTGVVDEGLEELELTKDDVEVVLSQASVNMEAKDYLASTDWYVTRQAETGKAIPEDILTKRPEARDSIVESN